MKVIAVLFCVGFMKTLADESKKVDNKYGELDSNQDLSGDFNKDRQCVYGYYDEKTNSCIKNICPPDSLGILPICSCIKEKFEYSESLNICYRYCPDNTTGYWPNCVCDEERAVFEKTLFECKSCPPESNVDSVYPNCDCSAVGEFDFFNDVCKKCPPEFKGIFPDCKCDNELASYDIYLKTCRSCPIDSVGIPPNCECKNGTGKLYNSYTNRCECQFGETDSPNVCVPHCPYGSTGIYNECKCKNEDATYVKEQNACVLCPYNSVGKYPNCTCPDHRKSEDHFFGDAFCKYCPVGSVGKHPNCICNDSSLYNQKTNACLRCPVNSAGIYPHCTCSDANATFSAFINKCYIACSEDSIGIYPNCRCDDFNFYYDPNDRVCKTMVGRKCPVESIGIGPDCLCMRSNYTFFTQLWECVNKNAMFSSPNLEFCPEGTNKWPQCDISLQPKILSSLVG